MNMYLSALGWIVGAPAGNRLRWSYPLQATDSGGKFLGLPEAVVVERAWVTGEIPQPTEGYSIAAPPVGAASLPSVPFDWWDKHGDVTPSGFMPSVLTLPKPVQAVRFIYQGLPARLMVYDSGNNLLLTERVLGNGEFFHLEAAAIDRFEVLALSATFENFMTLDLFADRGLKWEEIATIHVADTVNFGLGQVQPRYDLPVTLTDTEWKDFVKLANEGGASSPATLVDGDPTPWDSFELVMGIRWEHAVLFGHAFFDGPRGDPPEMDDYHMDLLLKTIAPKAAAYRVHEVEGRAGQSNIAVCPPWPVAPLTAPSQPQYLNATVRLTIDPETDKEKFVTSYGLLWQQVDPHALGAEIEENITASPTIASAPQTLTYRSQSHRPEDPPQLGALVREQDVVFHDVQLRARDRAIDGWDRVSAWSPFSPWVSPVLHHEPPAPALRTARASGGTTHLRRQVGDPNFPDWTPDPVIAHDPGAQVFVYRRKTGSAGQPDAQNVTIGMPIHVSGNNYRATISGASGLSKFLNGSLVVEPFRATISEVNGNDVTFVVGNGGNTLFSAGPAQLYQSPMALSLWTKIHAVSAHALPDELIFPDPVPGPSGTADVLSYHARLSFLGRIGPPSNTVQALRVPPVPVVPPPFSVEMLGVDFYNRTMVKIRFTNSVSGGLYTVWWAAGSFTSAQFGPKAVPGLMRAQTPYKNRYLFDVLAIPLPQTVNRAITIGVQHVNEGEGQSGFETVQITLPALAATP